MKKITIAVIFDQKISIGGGFQQALNSAIECKNASSEIFEFIFFSTQRQSIYHLNEHNLNPIYIRLTFLNKLVSSLMRRIRSKLMYRFLDRIFSTFLIESKLLKFNIDLVFLSASSLSLDLNKLNYILTLWDVCHLDEPEFPEVRSDREFERREETNRKSLIKAVAVFVDSNVSRQKVSKHYGLSINRVLSMPFQPSINISQKKYQIVDIKKEFKINCEYIFYPAQFWAHKNHAFILYAIKELERDGVNIGAVFSGTDQGNLTFIKNLAQELGLSERVKFPGFVEDKFIASLYSSSIALVMPSYFGPTNIPPLEAFKVGTPVLCPNKEELKEQIDDAALLFDMTNPSSLASQIKTLMESQDLREMYINRGRKKISEYTLKNSEIRVRNLNKVLHEFRLKKNSWM